MQSFINEPVCNLLQTKDCQFCKHGFLQWIAGGHTTGAARCSTSKWRLYNQNGNKLYIKHIVWGKELVNLVAENVGNTIALVKSLCRS
ncbi:hypothetical protein V6N13_065732 [Hibiscus sabdariffa]